MAEGIRPQAAAVITTKWEREFRKPERCPGLGGSCDPISPFAYIPAVPAGLCDGGGVEGHEWPFVSRQLTFRQPWGFLGLVTRQGQGLWWFDTQRGRLVIRRFRASMWQKGSQLAAPVTPCGSTSNPRATVCTQHNGGGGVLLQEHQIEQMALTAAGLASLRLWSSDETQASVFSSVK